MAALDIHDDTLEAVCFSPAKARKSSGELWITVFRAWKRHRRQIRFMDCANVQFVLDADVLRDNSPMNTSHAIASTNSEKKRSFAKKQKSAWGVRYDKDIDPLKRKLKDAKRLTLFRVQFFGGRIEVLAKGYQVRHLTNRSKSGRDRRAAELRR